MTIHSIVIQKLLSTNAHLGRRVAADHFKIYTYGIRNSQAIIDSDKTLICLRNAANFIAHLARDKKARFLFVNTNPLFDEIVEQMTKKIGLYSPRDNILWRMGGFLTNSFSPKKFRSRNKKVCFGPIQPPDCVVVLDTERKSSVILEADRLQVPIVALVDSSMPWEFYKKIAYPIPANDSVQFVYLFCNMITKTFLLEQKKLKAMRGDVAVEEPVASKKESRENVKQIEQSESESESKVSTPIEELLVVPYQNLTPAPNDIVEIKQLLDKLVVVKFNGSLGTSLGFSGPKSAIEVRNGLTSLDLIVNQVESLNSKYGCHVPLVLMNATKTHDDTLKVLGKYSKSSVDIHPFILESLGEHNSNEKSYASDDASAFLSLMKSGTLDVLLSQGKEYAHVISSDNYAAALDPNVLNHLIQNKIEYCMEVTPTASTYMRNSMANQRQGRFQVQCHLNLMVLYPCRCDHLREIMQNPSKHLMEEFKFIDTRSLWVNLKAIKRLVDTNALKMENLSISKLFDQAVGIIVPQSRFVPLNATSDLLLLQSDLYSSSEGTLVWNAARDNPINPSIELGPEFEKVSDYLSRFKSIPSITGLDGLKVIGDVWFGAGVTLKGRVSIVAKPGQKLEIPDGVVLENKEINDPADI
ncbi:UTP--glucose-1-phosphate uridylyltransferase isoform X2 [Manihot esculenta]|uniref:UTP--glucose-1-phosphate uridylyltransferase isoform X2 n=1 Tax=Manihot esculenta TaxID=3983 RepID=UPI001CC375B1|nr:UTP--glucose-1-phosphate uridylyltransferase isoform X2 [Manihot esculenta]